MENKNIIIIISMVSLLVLLSGTFMYSSTEAGEASAEMVELTEKDTNQDIKDSTAEVVSKDDDIWVIEGQYMGEQAGLDVYISDIEEQDDGTVSVVLDADLDDDQIGAQVITSYDYRIDVNMEDNQQVEIEFNDVNNTTKTLG